MAKNAYQSPRGTNDILVDDQPYWQQIRKVSNKTLEGLGFDRIDLPHFEDFEIFSRGIGESTDIVQK
jgi:histidyl-tRNA synthetase